MTSWTFEEHRKQLDLVKPVLEEFGLRHGLQRDHLVGRYPRLRYEKEVAARHRVWIDYWMTLDEDDQYRQHCDDQTPYELSGGASVVREEEGRPFKYYVVRARYRNRPFSSSVRTLPEDLEALLDELVSISAAEIVNTGLRKMLREQ